MRNCQMRLNMNYEIYIEESSPVRVLSNVIDAFHKDLLYLLLKQIYPLGVLLYHSMQAISP